MRYWLDTEFIEDGKTIDLISIGIVAEDGRELYRLNADFDWSKASPWVKENVLASIPNRASGLVVSEDDAKKGWAYHDNIADDVMTFLGGEWYSEPQETGIPGVGAQRTTRKLALGNSKPEIWAYYGSYDWVVFCQLFGAMMDLPKGFPMYCRDIKQMCDDLGNPELPKQGKGEHNALADARWNRDAWEFLQDLREKPARQQNLEGELMD